MSAANPPRLGLFSTVSHAGRNLDTLKDQRDWQQLADTSEPVGACRGIQTITDDSGRRIGIPCEGVMFALPTPDDQEPTDPIWWQEAQCNVCHHTIASPNRRTLVRSSARGEMPHGYWEERMRRLRPTETTDT